MPPPGEDKARHNKSSSVKLDKKDTKFQSSSFQLHLLSRIWARYYRALQRPRFNPIENRAQGIHWCQLKVKTHTGKALYFSPSSRSAKRLRPERSTERLRPELVEGSRRSLTSSPNQGEGEPLAPAPLSQTGERGWGWGRNLLKYKHLSLSWHRCKALRPYDITHPLSPKR